MWRGALATLGVSGLLLIVFAEFSGELSIIEDASRGTEAPWGMAPQLRDKEQSRLTPHASSTAASPQDEASVLNQLGTRYLEGRGLERNVEMAFFLFGLAAERGDADALNNLGRMYETGSGTQRDQQRAIKFYKEAAKKGNQLAHANLVRLDVQDANSTAEQSVGGRTFDQLPTGRVTSNHGIATAKSGRTNQDVTKSPSAPPPVVAELHRPKANRASREMRESTTGAVPAIADLNKPKATNRVIRESREVIRSPSATAPVTAQVNKSNKTGKQEDSREATNSATDATEARNRLKRGVIEPAAKPAKPAPKVVQSNTAAVHSGVTLIKWPPARVVQSNTAAVHSGVTLIKWPPARVVQSKTAAVHAGAKLIKWPPARVVQSNTAAMHAGATLIKPPSPSADTVKPKPSSPKMAQSKFAQTSTAAVPQAPAPILKRKIAPPDRDWSFYGVFLPYVSQQRLGGSVTELNHSAVVDHQPGNTDPTPPRPELSIPISERDTVPPTPGNIGKAKEVQTSSRADTSSIVGLLDELDIPKLPEVSGENRSPIAASMSPSANRSRKLLRPKSALQSLKRSEAASDPPTQTSRVSGRSKFAFESPRTSRAVSKTKQVLSKKSKPALSRSKQLNKRFSRRLRRDHSGRVSAALRSLVDEPVIIFWEDCSIGNWRMGPRC